MVRAETPPRSTQDPPTKGWGRTSLWRQKTANPKFRASAGHAAASQPARTTLVHQVGWIRRETERCARHRGPAEDLPRPGPDEGRFREGHRKCSTAGTRRRSGSGLGAPHTSGGAWRKTGSRNKGHALAPGNSRRATQNRILDWEGMGRGGCADGARPVTPVLPRPFQRCGGCRGAPLRGPPGEGTAGAHMKRSECPHARTLRRCAIRCSLVVEHAKTFPTVRWGALSAPWGPGTGQVQCC